MERKVVTMDLLDRLLGHDAGTTRELLGICARLTEEELDREFDIGHRSVRRTLVHVIRNMEVWTDLMAGGPVRSSEAGPAHTTNTTASLLVPLTTPTKC